MGATGALAALVRRIRQQSYICENVHTCPERRQSQQRGELGTGTGTTATGNVCWEVGTDSANLTRGEARTCTLASTTSFVSRRISRHRWKALPNRDFLRSCTTPGTQIRGASATAGLWRCRSNDMKVSKHFAQVAERLRPTDQVCQARLACHVQAAGLSARKFRAIQSEQRPRIGCRPVVYLRYAEQALHVPVRG